jgi:hypothetical protein
VSSQGSAYARFRRALLTGNLFLIRKAAAELPRVNLRDALDICVAIREAEPAGFERAALRWLARYCVEYPGATLTDVLDAAGAFERMAGAGEPDEPLDMLRRLCHR